MTYLQSGRELGPSEQGGAAPLGEHAGHFRLIDRTGLLDGILQEQPGGIAASGVVLGCTREAPASYYDLVAVY